MHCDGCATAWLTSYAAGGQHPSQVLLCNRAISLSVRCSSSNLSGRHRYDAGVGPQRGPHQRAAPQSSPGAGRCTHQVVAGRGLSVASALLVPNHTDAGQMHDVGAGAQEALTCASALLFQQIAARGCMEGVQHRVAPRLPQLPVEHARHLSQPCAAGAAAHLPTPSHLVVSTALRGGVRPHAQRRAAGGRPQGGAAGRACRCSLSSQLWSLRESGVQRLAGACRGGAHKGWSAIAPTGGALESVAGLGLGRYISVAS